MRNLIWAAILCVLAFPLTLVTVGTPFTFSVPAILVLAWVLVKRA